MRCSVTVLILSVCVYICVCLSVTTKSAVYLIITLQAKFYRALNGVFKDFTMWSSLKTLYLLEFWRFIGFFVVFSRFLPSLKMLCSRVLESFAGHRRLPCSLASFRWINETAVASFQLRKYVVTLVINPVTTGSSLIVAH